MIMDSSAQDEVVSKDLAKALWKISKVVLDTLDFNEVSQKICDSLLSELGYLNLGYRIIVLSLYDKESGGLKRVSLSQTPEAKAATAASAIPFEKIVIPIDQTENYCVRAFLDQKKYVTTDWKDILTPPLSPQEARTNQEASGIKTSMILPILLKGKSVGVVIFSMVKGYSEVKETELELLSGFTDIVAIAVQNAELYSNLEQTSQKLDQANNRLHELDKLKSEFVSVASHELRTPMTAIKSYLWMAIAGRGGNITDKQKYYLERAYVSTDRLIKLVNDLLNVSRIESGKLSVDMQKLDVANFVNEVIAEVKPRADELGITINNEAGKNPLPPVLADSDKIKEVLINFIGNSLKFTKQGGWVKIWCDFNEKFVGIHVTDNGEGLDSNDIPKLFQKFGLVKGSYITNQNAAQGTGLGLFISKSIVELHNGTIDAQSEGKGKGATFSFTLPIYTDAGFTEAQKHKGTEGLGIIHSTLD